MPTNLRVIVMLKETAPGETRVAITPEIVGKLTKAGLKVLVEPGAGLGASVRDGDYAEAGAELAPAARSLPQAELLLTVRGPQPAAIAQLPAGAVVVGLLDPFRNEEALRALAAKCARAY